MMLKKLYCGLYFLYHSQRVQEMEELSSIRYEREQRYQSCGPVSSLEPAYSEGSCNSLDSNKSISSEGRNASSPYIVNHFFSNAD